MNTSVGGLADRVHASCTVKITTLDTMTFEPNRRGVSVVEIVTLLLPDVVVMEIAMPEMTGVEATRQIRALAPSVRVLVLTAYEDDPYIYSLLDAGATGYILKTAESREIVRAVRATAAGQSAIDPAVAPRLIARITRPPAGGDTLTERELDVLRRAARGLTNKQIGLTN